MITFLTYDIKNYYLSFIISYIFDILHCIMTFPGSHSVIFVRRISDVTSEIKSSDVTFNITCELSQPMGKTEFSSTAENRKMSHR